MTPDMPAMDEKRTQLFLDCDGVLADFDTAFTAQFGHPPRVYEEHNGSNIFWRNIREEATEFYRHLPLMPDARRLYEAVAYLRPIILTGCPVGGWAESQKLAWAAEHFPGVPMITCMSKDKRVFCKPGDILIDDWPKYRGLWEDAGGRFILHTDAESSIDALRASLKAVPEVEVVKLEWAQPENKMTWFADTLIGRYRIFAYEAGDFAWSAESLFGVNGGTESLGAAKAAAQADFASRIRSCLAQPAPGAEVKP